MAYFVDSFVTGITFSQIVVLYWLAAPASFRLLRQSYLNRNPAWAAATPGYTAADPAPRYPVVIAALLGLAWLIKFAMDWHANEGWPDGTAALLWPALLWLVLEVGVAGAEYYRLYRHIPVPAKRRVVVERRRLADYIHPAWCYPAVALLLAVTCTYIGAFAHELIDVEVALLRGAGLLLGAILWAAALYHSVSRKKQPIDDALGPHYRGAEVRAIVACLYVFGLLSAEKAVADIFGIHVLRDRYVLAITSLALQLLVLFWMTFNFSTRKQHVH